MPFSVTLLCQIQSKGQDGKFMNSLEMYIIETEKSKTFHYGFYKKQLSMFLYNFQVADYVLLCDKCIFNCEIMYISIKTINNILYILYLLYVK